MKREHQSNENWRCRYCLKQQDPDCATLEQQIGDKGCQAYVPGWPPMWLGIAGILGLGIIGLEGLQIWIWAAVEFFLLGLSYFYYARGIQLVEWWRRKKHGPKV